MALLSDLRDGIYLLDAHYVAEQVAAIYLVQQQQKIAVIETGTHYSLPFIEQALAELGLGFDAVEYVIPTHIHLDHAGGAGALMERCANAMLLVHPRGAPHMIDPQKLEAGTKAVYGEAQFAKLYGSLKSIDKDRVIAVEDQQMIHFNGREFYFLHTPGHALHHFCVFDNLSQGVFTGDTFGLAYPQLMVQNKPFIFATTTPVHFDPEAMQNSIELILAQKPKQLFLTHFGPVKPTQDVVQQLISSINAFVKIALQYKNQTVNRIEKIQTGILEWLLKELRTHSLDQQRLSALLQVDALLNAQGLDVWLRRKNL